MDRVFVVYTVLLQLFFENVKSCHTELRNVLLNSVEIIDRIFIVIIDSFEDVKTLDFSSLNFLLYFLPIFFLFYVLTPSRFKNITLIAGSFVFYMQGEAKYLYVLPVSVLAHFWIAGCIDPFEKKNNREKEDLPEGAKQKNIVFMVAVAADVAVLLYFKLRGAGLPLGLSFYTFQVISYLTDVWRGEIGAERSLFRFVTYLSMFPKIGSGPITPYGTVRDALKERTFTAEKFQDGLRVFAMGLAAKTLLADPLGILWNDLLVKGYESISWRYAWLGAIGYSMKLYFDFYGYSLMAVGLGRMTGFELPDNFRVPYMAGSVREFYRRWHITLGGWFKKYVYIPLGGSRKGERRTFINLMIVWILTGLWHGISPNFLIWGLFLGFCIMLERIVGKINWPGKIKIVTHVYLWFVIPISWMFFAISDVSQLQIYLTRMFGIGEGININPADWLICLKNYGILLAAGAVCCSGIVEKIYDKWKDRFWLNAILAALFWLCVEKIILAGNNPFMYLNF